MTILITGSNGKTASHLTQMLHSSKQPILVASRRPREDSPFPNVRFDWTDQSTFELPFAHAQANDSPITAAYLVGPDVMNVSQLVLRFVDYARRRGVKRFVLVSAWEIPAGGPLNGRTHQELEILGARKEVEWTVLRPHFFMGRAPLHLFNCQADHLRKLHRIVQSQNDSRRGQDLFCGRRWTLAIYFGKRHCCNGLPGSDRREAAQHRLCHYRRRVSEPRPGEFCFSICACI